MDELTIKVIQSVHILLMVMIIYIPFTNSPYLLMLHALFIPFLWLHWLTNNDTCVLTMLEKKLKGVEDDECFTCQLINPIFNFKKSNQDASKMIYTITIGLWLISVGKLAYKISIGEIKDIRDLFMLKK